MPSETFDENTPVQLIFNPRSRENKESPDRLEKIVTELQDQNFRPEVYIVEPDRDFSDVIHRALEQHIMLFAACGGDGTVSAVAKELAGKRAALGILPGGTQNNIALSLGIPDDISGSIALLREGRRRRIDMGRITCGKYGSAFLEFCSVGLFSTLFPSCDEIQHGNLTRIGDFLTEFASAPQARFDLVLDGGQKVSVTSPMLFVTNMPYIIRHFQISEAQAYRDGLLDLLLFEDISKMNLMGYVLTGPTPITDQDSRIQRLRARTADIIADPVLPVMVDGRVLEEKGEVHISMRKQSLTVMLARANRTGRSEKREK